MRTRVEDNVVRGPHRRFRAGLSNTLLFSAYFSALRLTGGKTLTTLQLGGLELAMSRTPDTHSGRAGLLDGCADPETLPLYLNSGAAFN